MFITLEIYTDIRRLRLGRMSQRQIAGALHISHNTVKKYWDGNSVPWERKDYSGEATVYLKGIRTTVNLFCARMCYSDVPVPIVLV